MDIKVKPYKIIKFMVALIIYIGVGIIFRWDKVLFYCIFAMNLYCIYRAKENNMIFIVYLIILLSNHSIYLFYWTDKISYTHPTGGYRYYLQYPEIMHLAVLALYVFNAFLFILQNHFRSTEIKIMKSYAIDEYSNRFMAYMLMLLIALISSWSIVIRIRAGSMLHSTIYEYMTIPFIIAIYYARKDKILNAVIITLIVINVMYVFINGDRGAAIQFLMIFYAAYCVHKIPKKILMLVLLIGVIGLEAIGMWRGRYQFSFDVIMRSARSLVTTGSFIDTAYAAEACSLGVLMLAEKYSVMERLLLFLYYILYTFTATKFTGSEANLAALSMINYPYSNGGGILPNYGYFYLGTIGVIGLAALVNKYMNYMAHIDSKTSGYIKCLSVYIFATSMMWYMYSPSPLIRGVLLFSICYVATCRIKLK